MGHRKRSRPSRQEGSRWLHWTLGAIAGIAIVTGVVYANSLHNEFLFDDLETIVELGRRGGYEAYAPLRNLLRGGLAYRPIRTASYAFDYALSGLDPWGYHLSNIAYHTLSAVFVFLIAQTLFARVRPAIVTALIFAVHPIQTDSVTYMSGRRDVLSGLFVLAGFYAFLRYRRSAHRGYLALAMLAYPLAFFSKESGIILPLLCFSYDLVERVRVNARRPSVPPLREIWRAALTAFRDDRLLYLPFLILGAGLASYVLFLVRGTWQRSYHGGTFWLASLTMARVFIHYITLLLFPVRLSADYSYNAFPVTTSWTDARALIAAVILAAVGYGVVSCLGWRPLAAFGGIWFFVALLPVSQIVPHHEMMAEHYLYVPSVGFFLMVVALIDPLLDHPRLAPAISIGVALALILLSLRTVWRNRDWKDDLSLWSQTVRVAPEAARARNNLGGAYLRRGQLALAQEQLEAALRIRPDLASARANLGKLYLDRGAPERAELELLEALRLKGNEMIPRLWLGVAYVRKGQMADAEQQFRSVLSSPPYDAYAYNNLGAIFARSGRVAEAKSAFREALRRMPDLAEAADNLSRLERLSGPEGVAASPVKRAAP